METHRKGLEKLINAVPGYGLYRFIKDYESKPVIRQDTETREEWLQRIDDKVDRENGRFAGMLLYHAGTLVGIGYGAYRLAEHFF